MLPQSDIASDIARAAAALPFVSLIEAPAPARVQTGFPVLDTALGGGWPVGMLTELLVPGPGSGELGLLSPALARLTNPPASPLGTNLSGPPVNSSGGGKWALLIAPPWIPYAPGLCWQGLALNRVLMAQVRQPPEVLWAMEEALRSGTCAAVVAWAGATATNRAGRSLLQRLHLLSGKQQAWTVLIRAARFRRERSPARLRVQLLRPSPATLQLEIFKNGWRRTGSVTVELQF